MALPSDDHNHTECTANLNTPKAMKYTIEQKKSLYFITGFGKFAWFMF